MLVPTEVMALRIVVASNIVIVVGENRSLFLLAQKAPMVIHPAGVKVERPREVEWKYMVTL